MPACKPTGSPARSIDRLAGPIAMHFIDDQSADLNDCDAARASQSAAVVAANAPHLFGCCEYHCSNLLIWICICIFALPPIARPSARRLAGHKKGIGRRKGKRESFSAIVNVMSTHERANKRRPVKLVSLSIQLDRLEQTQRHLRLARPSGGATLLAGRGSVGS